MKRTQVLKRHAKTSFHYTYLTSIQQIKILEDKVADMQGLGLTEENISEENISEENTAHNVLSCYYYLLDFRVERENIRANQYG